jgi:hypothetical protein
MTVETLILLAERMGDVYLPLSKVVSSLLVMLLWS